MFRVFLSSIVTVWLAFLTAVLVESHRPANLKGVAGLEPTNKPSEDLLDLIEQSVWHRSTPLVLSEAAVNRYLGTVLNGRQAGPSYFFAQFDRVALDFQPGMCRLMLFWNTRGLRSTASIDFTVTRDKQEFVIVPVGGSYGRLPILRGALAMLIPACRSLCNALESDIRAISQMNEIRFEKQKVVLDPRFNAKR